MHVNRNPESLNSITCDVTNCVYNSANKACHASHIMVANQTVNNGDKLDTFCGTFVAK